MSNVKIWLSHTNTGHFFFFFFFNDRRAAVSEIFEKGSSRADFGQFKKKKIKLFDWNIMTGLKSRKYLIWSGSGQVNIDNMLLIKGIIFPRIMPNSIQLNSLNVACFLNIKDDDNNNNTKNNNNFYYYHYGYYYYYCYY